MMPENVDHLTARIMMAMDNEYPSAKGKLNFSVQEYVLLDIQWRCPRRFIRWEVKVGKAGKFLGYRCDVTVDHGRAPVGYAGSPAVYGLE